MFLWTQGMRVRMRRALRPHCREAPRVEGFYGPFLRLVSEVSDLIRRRRSDLQRHDSTGSVGLEEPDADEVLPTPAMDG